MGLYLFTVGATELILAGGLVGSQSSSVIWNYIVKLNTWNKIGELLTAEKEFGMTSVTGVKCYP